MKRLFQLFLLALLVTVEYQAKAQPNFQLTNIQVVETTLGYSQELRITSTLQYNGIQQNSTEILQIGCQTIHDGSVKTNLVTGFAQTINLVQPFGQIDVDTIRIPVNSTYFSDGGGHTVIVWPIIGIPNIDIDSTVIGSEIEVLSWLNQKEWAAEKQARIFPVPASDYLLLEKPEGKATVSILDVQGRLVTTLVTNEKQIRIPLNHLSRGNYFMRYSDGVKPPEIHSFIKE